MRAWAADGVEHDLAALLADAAALPSGGPTIDVDDPAFIPPGDMPRAHPRRGRPGGRGPARHAGGDHRAASSTRSPRRTPAPSPRQHSWPDAASTRSTSSAAEPRTNCSVDGPRRCRSCRSSPVRSRRPRSATCASRRWRRARCPTTSTRSAASSPGPSHLVSYEPDPHRLKPAHASSGSVSTRIPHGFRPRCRIRRRSSRACQFERRQLAEIPADDLVGDDPQPGVAAVVVHLPARVLGGVEPFRLDEFGCLLPRARNLADRASPRR